MKITSDQLNRAATVAAEVVWRKMWGTEFWSDTRPDHQEFIKEELEALLPALDALGIDYPDEGDQ